MKNRDSLLPQNRGNSHHASLSNHPPSLAQSTSICSSGVFSVLLRWFYAPVCNPSCSWCVGALWRCVRVAWGIDMARKGRGAAREPWGQRTRLARFVAPRESRKGMAMSELAKDSLIGLAYKTYSGIEYFDGNYDHLRVNRCSLRRQGSATVMVAATVRQRHPPRLSRGATMATV